MLTSARAVVLVSLLTPLPALAGPPPAPAMAAGPLNREARSAAVMNREARSAAVMNERIARILPTADEDRWLEVPWRTSLLRARREANDSGKPILMWLMDGDPLGGT